MFHLWPMTSTQRALWTLAAGWLALRRSTVDGSASVVNNVQHA